MFFTKCKNCCHRCGGISPVKATDAMTQPVGQRDGQLFTTPGEGVVFPVDKTEEMTQPVGVDAEGKLFTKPGGGSGAGIQEITDTEEITAEVDESGKAKLYLNNDVSSKLARALLTPVSPPAVQKVVTIDENGAEKLEDYSATGACHTHFITMKFDLELENAELTVQVVNNTSTPFTAESFFEYLGYKTINVSSNWPVDAGLSFIISITGLLNINSINVNIINFSGWSHLTRDVKTITTSHVSTFTDTVV